MSERIGVLLPLKEQREEYLSEAVRSIRDQTSGAWELLVGIDPAAPAAMRRWFDRLDEERVRIVPVDRSGFAAALNALMAAARTEFVAILLSDDRFAPSAIEILLRHRALDPEADFLHSARRYIDADGRPLGEVMPSRPRFDLDHFIRWGSPVKHLLCWRRELGVRIGGMDESLSRHGCDDFDFPWRMAEAGARFHAVPECLYEYRVHDRGPRLTTDTPLQEQIEILERIFSRHRIARPTTVAFQQRASRDYLLTSHFGLDGREAAPPADVRCFREADMSAWPRFRERGFHQRHFFPHRVYVLPRGGPDGAKLAERMCGICDPAALREAVLFAGPEAVAGLPGELFVDDDLVWHQQQLGLPGQVANAGLVLAEADLYVTVMFSDVVQRIGRRREHKTRVEARLKGWAHLLINAVLEHALDLGCRAVYVPTSGLAMAETDRERTVQPALFERVYDRTVTERAGAERAGEWWRIDLASVERRVAPLDRKVSLERRGTTICVAHDVERGRGHRETDPDFAARAERFAPDHLERMLAVERDRGVRATYCVLGALLDEVRAPIEAGGHALGFHSHGHVLPEGRWRRWRARLRRPWEEPSRAALRTREFRELVRCRDVDYRLKGYRPPQSRLGPGLDDRHLAYFGFEWLASSAWSLGIDRPAVENGLVKIPIHLDDYDLHRGAVSYDAWERTLLDLVAGRDFVAVGLHDCYADRWLPRYSALLGRLGELGTLRTFTQVADDEMLAHSGWC